MLSSSERRTLRAQSHSLKPTVMLGQQGLTPTVLAAINEALTAHELIKVRLRGVEREARSNFSAQIATEAEADIVHTIGHILTLYRANPEPLAPVARPPVRRPAKARRK